MKGISSVNNFEYLVVKAYYFNAGMSKNRTMHFVVSKEQADFFFFLINFCLWT